MNSEKIQQQANQGSEQQGSIAEQAQRHTRRPAGGILDVLHGIQLASDYKQQTRQKSPASADVHAEGNHCGDEYDQLFHRILLNTVQPLKCLIARCTRRINTLFSSRQTYPPGKKQVLEQSNQDNYC